MDSDDLALENAIRKRRKAARLSLEELASRTGISVSQLSRIERGVRQPSLKNLRSLARELNVPIGELAGQAGVPVVGYVGAGYEAHFYGEGHGLDDEAPAPPDRTPNTVAVIVRGDSQLGIADEGYLLYYDDRRDPPTDDLIGELCVIGLSDGRVLVKYLYRGRAPGHYDLHSRNAPPLLDQVVEWAAKVKWIKPR